jgi:hypothetical protein
MIYRSFHQIGQMVCGSGISRYSSVFTPCQTGGSTPEIVNLFVRESFSSNGRKQLNIEVKNLRLEVNKWK